MYYKEASESIALCIASNLEDLSPIDRQIAILEQYSPDKVGTQRRIAANLDALEAFRLMIDDLDLKGSEPELGDQTAEKLIFYGVNVSVRPEIILRSKGRSGQKLVGAIKLHFPKTYSLNEHASGLVSAVLQEWLDRFMESDGKPLGENCYVIDIGARRICKGVRSTVTRLRDIESNCQNIAALWPSI